MANFTKARALNKRDYRRNDRSSVEGFKQAQRYVQINRIRRVKTQPEVKPSPTNSSREGA